MTRHTALAVALVAVLVLAGPAGLAEAAGTAQRRVSTGIVQQVWEWWAGILGGLLPGWKGERGGVVEKKGGGIDPNGSYDCRLDCSDPRLLS